MQYAYARVRSIFRKGGHEAEDHRADAGPIPLAAPEELALGKMLLRFPEALERALEGYQPNVLAAYLYDLAQAFTARKERKERKGKIGGTTGRQKDDAMRRFCLPFPFPRLSLRSLRPLRLRISV
ncbi:MAG: DALR anticodon-binding domain-containing protein [Candidatus Sumerlaeota bacterium]|nr:DALR anticodon-binding domain-containing protein [Candidatus Sumerlaeota bacterium]